MPFKPRLNRRIQLSASIPCLRLIVISQCGVIFQIFNFDIICIVYLCRNSWSHYVSLTAQIHLVDFIKF
jgi:hypothetical protein